jgi:DNA-binding response OmpR family regulator
MARPVVDVLLVEDDEADAHRIERMLKRAEDVQFHVRTAVSLNAALTVVQSRPPSIVLLDLSLEDFHGYDTAVEFAKQADVPFIVLTGNDDMTMAMRCTSLGAQDYILKNDVQAKPLERTILMALKRSSDAAASREMDRKSREVVLGDPDQATVSMLRPRVSSLVEAVEDLESFIQKNAPGLMDDVRSILAKHNVDLTIKALRDVLRLHADRESERPRKISDQALKAVDSVIKKRRTIVGAPAPGGDADRELLDVIRKLETQGGG